MKVFGRESYKADSVLEAQLVLFRRPTNNPTGDLEAISNSKDTFVKAAMIQGVGSVDREIESVLPPAKISLRNFVCFYYKVKNTITTHDKANCCLMVRKIGLKVQNGDDGVDDDHTSYLSFFFLHRQNFWRIKFTPKNA